MVWHNCTQIAHPDYVFPYIDEPFHRKPFLDYSAATRAEFKRQYGYAMPKSLKKPVKILVYNWTS